MENKTLVTDFYELTMAQTYFDKNEQDEEVYFDIFFRKNPFDGGYAISGGLESIIDYINNFKIDEEEIKYLRSLNVFKEEFLKYLKDLKFTGDIYAVKEGTPIFPNEPVITIKAKKIVAQLIETPLLTCFNSETLIATATRRVIKEALNTPVMEFGLRRGHGLEAGVKASRTAYIAGCVGTSNTYAGMKYKIPVMGTMAHSLIMDAESEYDAFLTYAKSNPNNCVFLVDTYDTLRSGVKNAIKVAQDYLIPNGYKFKGIRIDSGDLAYLSKEARKLLDEAGFTDTAICLSNGLDANTISNLKQQGVSVNSFGVGDNITASKERVGGVYKLAAIKKDGKILPRIKISGDTIKTTNPGYKKVYRFYDKETGYALGDLIALADEIIPKDKFTLVHPTERWKKIELTNYEVSELQVPIFIDGKQIYNLPTIEELKAYSQKEFDTLYPEVTRLLNPHEYYVDLSDKLVELKQNLINFYKNNEALNDESKVYIKCKK